MRNERKTRNQRRREMLEHLFTGFALIAMCVLLMAVLCGMACKALEHPAEQPVDGREYIEMVQKWGADHALQNR